MTLQEAVEKQYYEEPTKRIIREPNRKGWCSNWFSFDIKQGKLMFHDITYRGTDKDMHTVMASKFQLSQHTDWILI